MIPFSSVNEPPPLINQAREKISSLIHPNISTSRTTIGFCSTRVKMEIEKLTSQRRTMVTVQYTQRMNIYLSYRHNSMCCGRKRIKDENRFIIFDVPNTINQPTWTEANSRHTSQLVNYSMEMMSMTQRCSKRNEQRLLAGLNRI